MINVYTHFSLDTTFLSQVYKTFFYIKNLGPRFHNDRVDLEKTLSVIKNKSKFFKISRAAWAFNHSSLRMMDNVPLDRYLDIATRLACQAQKMSTANRSKYVKM